MSSTFSISRLAKLIAKQFYENARFYGFSILALVALLALVFTFWFNAGGAKLQEEETYIIFMFGLFLTGTIFSSISFSMLGSKDKGIYWLSVPATHLEKLLCTIFYSTIVFTLVYALCFLLVKTVAITFINQYILTHPNYSYTEMKGSDQNFGKVFKYFMFAYFSVQALYLLGSVYFKRYAFILTTVVTAIGIFAFVYYITKLQGAFIAPANFDFIAATRYDPSLKDGYYNYAVSPVVASVFKFMIQFAWAPLFWIVTWFKLKEKEI